MDPFIFKCPHCDENILVNKNETNCLIFRHAVLKNSGEPINPHSSKEECERLLKAELIYGCAKPFRVEINGDTIIPIICEYI
jgi:hypothetical protein